MKKEFFKDGFTLIELLVVIAVIALLLSVIMPSLKSAKRLAQGVVCVANESQLIKSYILYAEDNDSFIVDGDVSDNIGNAAGYMTFNRPEGTVTVHTWTGRPMGSNYAASNETIGDKINGFEVGGLWPYIESPKSYNCPGDKRSHDYVQGVGLLGYRTYSVGKPLSRRNDWANFGEAESEIFKLTNFVSPGNKVVFLEETERQMGWNHRTWNMSLDMSSPMWVDPLAVLHNDSSTFAFADGHAERHKWVDEGTKKMAELGTKNQPATTTGEAGAPISQDYRWMWKAYMPGKTPSVVRSRAR